MKPSASAVQHGTLASHIEAVRLFLGTHRAKHVDTHVKPRSLEIKEQLTRNRGLARTRNTIEQHNLPRDRMHHP